MTEHESHNVEHTHLTMPMAIKAMVFLTGLAISSTSLGVYNYVTMKHSIATIKEITIPQMVVDYKKEVKKNEELRKAFAAYQAREVEHEHTLDTRLNSIESSFSGLATNMQDKLNRLKELTNVLINSSRKDK